MNRTTLFLFWLSNLKILSLKNCFFGSVSVNWEQKSPKCVWNKPHNTLFIWLQLFLRCEMRKCGWQSWTTLTWLWAIQTCGEAKCTALFGQHPDSFRSLLGNEMIWVSLKTQWNLWSTQDLQTWNISRNVIKASLSALQTWSVLQILCWLKSTNHCLGLSIWWPFCPHQVWVCVIKRNTIHRSVYNPHHTVSRSDNHSTSSPWKNMTHNQTCVWSQWHPALQVYRGIELLVPGIRMVKTLKLKLVDLITDSAPGPSTWAAGEG